jgi:hypothetical protein
MVSMLGTILLVGASTRVILVGLVPAIAAHSLADQLRSAMTCLIQTRTELRAKSP